jgi:hypothetical protein
MNMLRKISFSEVCKRLTDEDWDFDMCTGRSPAGPYSLRGEYDGGCYGCQSIVIRFCHIPGFQFSHSDKILVALNFIYLQKVPWVTGVGPDGEKTYCPPQGTDWRPRSDEYMEWWKNSKELIGEDLRDGNLFSETYLAIDANFHKLSTPYLERLATIKERPIGSMQMDYEVPPRAFDMNGTRYSSNPCVTYINEAMTYWHNCEIVPGDVEDHVPILTNKNEDGEAIYKFDDAPIIEAKAWDLEMPTAEMNRFHIAVHKALNSEFTPYLFGGSETVDDLMNRLNAYVKSIVKVNDYAKNNAVLMKKAKEYYEVKKEYDQKREAFVAYQRKLEEVGDKLVYDYQLKGQYHA